ncbi:MAG TPA: enoyl-CoA hydratase/isomerase family protein [Streptosporangiaceae bacterium]|nr:enoyl-CoA hydratase/isomerase family protein [Streptosporangiaceae bacterium]
MRYIKAQHRGRALWITFDRPQKLNILHAEDLSELGDVIADLPSSVQAIVFTGAGEAAFSAGMNIEAFVGLTPARAHALIGDLAQVMRAIRHSPVVTVAAVNGYCLGAAFELALACDLRVVTPAASFGLPEIKVGVPSVIDAALLPAFVGLSKAREMILTGDIYKLDELPPGSIANVVAEPAELVAASESLLDRIATHPRTVTAAQRRLFDVWLNNPLDASAIASMAEFSRVFASQETHEQIARHHKRITG